MLYRIQSIGLGGLKPNTVILGWPSDWRKSLAADRSWSLFVDAVQAAAANKMALVVPKGIESFPESSQKVCSHRRHPPLPAHG